MTALLTEAEAAAIIRVSERTLRSIRAKGMIRYVRPSPRKVFYTPEDCAEYLEKHSGRDTPPCPSTNPRKAASGTSTSNGEVVAITAALAARRNGTRNATRPSSGGRSR